jgi:hypothetical protein
VGEDLGDPSFDGDEDRQGTALGHCSKSILNTRWSAKGAYALTGAFGMIKGGSLTLGASTPWKQIRCNRGQGTSVVRHYINSSGDITIWVVLSRQCLQCKHYRPGTVECQAFVGNGVAGEVAAWVFEFLARIDAEPRVL